VDIDGHDVDGHDIDGHDELDPIANYAEETATTQRSADPLRIP
jgi:hypothetical protein